ncbi:MAG: mechanosensitive ion channel family protein [Bacilli bacterium]|nr:mechanosensitive ion channel family protein [Bacilli bacterium]
MKLIEYISHLTSIDEIYCILTIKTLSFFLILTIIKKVGVKILKKIKDSKKEYLYIQKYKLLINITKLIVFLLLWGKYLESFITLISLISAGFTIALRDLIFNFFSGIYIKIKKPFEIEDRIEINNYKGDVININTLSFEVLEVNNQNFIGQSTGVITHLPNSLIFNHPLRNYNKAFKYIWNEMTFRVPLKCNLSKTKGVIYKIVNSNEVIKNIPPKMKNQINNSTSDYRIYYNQYEPIIYTQIVENHIELTVRYLIHPKKARYINSVISNKVLEAYQNEEIELYED